MASLKLNIVMVTAVAMTYMHFSTVTAFTSYVIGGARGWTMPPKPNHYEEWTKGKKFIKGDHFHFLFKDYEHTVATVKSKAEYDTCNTTGVENVSKWGGLLYRLQDPGIRYVICTLHCAKGHKVILDVKES